MQYALIINMKDSHTYSRYNTERWNTWATYTEAIIIYIVYPKYSNVDIILHFILAWFEKEFDF